MSTISIHNNTPGVREVKVYIRNPLNDDFLLGPLQELYHGRIPRGETEVVLLPDVGAHTGELGTKYIEIRVASTTRGARTGYYKLTFGNNPLHWDTLKVDISEIKEGGEYVDTTE